jgi:hypothetical protein
MDVDFVSSCLRSMTTLLLFQRKEVVLINPSLYHDREVIVYLVKWLKL